MVIQDAAKRLKNSETPLLDARVLLSYVTGGDALLLRRALTAEEKEKFENLLRRREGGEPVAYIVGEKEFMGYPFYVDKSCLIPRPDTETVVEYLIERFQGSSPKLFDLCCGSGCIGLSLALFLPRSQVTLGDISDGALKTTEKNIRRHKLEGRARAVKFDAFKDGFGEKYDIIVSNPPYIPSAIAKGLETDLREPILAFDGGENGLDFYRAITPKAASALNSGGVLSYEIGFDQGDAVRKILEDCGFKNVTIKKDFGNNDRLAAGEFVC